MDDLDYKKLIDEGREFLSLEMKYEKLTAVEKLSVLLSAIAFVAVVAIIGGFLVAMGMSDANSDDYNDYDED